MQYSTILTTVLAPKNSLSPILNRINIQFGIMNRQIEVDRTESRRQIKCR